MGILNVLAEETGKVRIDLANQNANFDQLLAGLVYLPMGWYPTSHLLGAVGSSAPSEGH